MVDLARAAAAPSEESTVANEVWRSRGAMARQAAAELREQMRLGLWVARRHSAYTRWLLEEARGQLGTSGGDPVAG
jgi:hypothetical protein